MPRMGWFFILMAALLVTGCTTAAPTDQPLPVDHPANAMAAEPPATTRPALLTPDPIITGGGVEGQR